MNWDFMTILLEWVLEYCWSTILGRLVLDLSVGDVECRAILLYVSLMSPPNNVYNAFLHYGHYFD